MKDIQNLRDDRRINIRKVGVKTISYPLTVLDKARRLQPTIATVNMYVNLPHCFKGTHMSRFIEILNRFHGEINLRNFHLILEEMKQRLDAEAAHVEIEFPYFLQSESLGNSLGVDRYECTLHGSLQEVNVLTLEVNVPIMLPLQHYNVCGLPNSMGRWGSAKVAVRFNKFMWIEDLINLVDQAIAARDNSLESAETVSCRIGSLLCEHPAICWFKVEVENLSPGFSTFASFEGPPKKSHI